MNFLKFLRTAPVTKSDKVLKLELAGLAHLLVEAVRSEKRGEGGYSKCKTIRVRKTT